jgi:hypothetical protein
MARCKFMYPRPQHNTDPAEQIVIQRSGTFCGLGKRLVSQVQALESYNQGLLPIGVN